MTQQLVLSLFPGADLFGMAFEAEGFCVVRGPDVLLGGEIRSWHVPAERFDGVIGGPPCKAHSRNITAGRKRKGEGVPTQDNLIPEFERLVCEALPRWFVMEEVPEAPLPWGGRDRVNATVLNDYLLEAWEFGSASRRRRRFTTNLDLGGGY